eukprot:XP_014070883.1 PREDICTED: protein CASP-like [Salmo salar]
MYMLRRYADLQLEFSSAVRTSAEQRALILKLEHDLSSIQTMSSMLRPDADERHHRYLSLSPWDKVTLSLGRGILSNKMARTVTFFYTLFLHCLVFLVLYKTAWSESIGRDCSAFCAKKYSDHLHRFHENGDNL